jgi:hypothetical protein
MNTLHSTYIIQQCYNITAHLIEYFARARVCVCARARVWVGARARASE